MMESPYKQLVDNTDPVGLEFVSDTETIIDQLDLNEEQSILINSLLDLLASSKNVEEINSILQELAIIGEQQGLDAMIIEVNKMINELGE